jgi:hypothetical protein
VLTPRPLAYDIVRQLTAEAREFPGCLLQIKAHPQVTQILQEESGPLLNRLAREHQVQVDLSPQPQFARDHFVISHEWPG